MNDENIAIIQECIQGSLNHELIFPEIVGRLASIGVERYHTDYCRQENTYYWPNGDSVVLPMPHAHHAIGEEFSVSEMVSAIRQSQRDEHTYLDFIAKTMAAGCVGYFVQITGRKAIYFGRKGESHTENFPPGP